MSEASEHAASDDMPADSFAEQWARAEAIAEAAERGEATPATDAEENGDPEPDAPAHGSGSGDATNGSEEATEADGAEDADDRPVAVSERAKWREEKRRSRAAIAAERGKAMAEVQQIADKARAELGPLLEAKKALEAGDFDGLARGLGHDDWKTLQAETLKRFQSPEYQRVQQLERDLRERQAREDAERKTQAEQRAQADQQKAREAYIDGDLARELGAIEDEQVRGLAEDPAFRRAVFAIQDREWDEHARETIPVAEAAREVVSTARKQYAKLHKIFGGQAASEPEDATASATRSGRASVPTRARKRSKTVTHDRAAEAAAPGTELSDDEWKRRAIKRLEQAESVYPE